MTDSTKRPPVTDGPWTIGPAPGYLRYMVLGEEGDQDLLVYGHDLTEDSVQAAIVHAGFGQVFDGIVIDGVPVADGTPVAELNRLATWAREMHGCPDHRRLPLWLRSTAVNTVNWVQWQVFRRVWRWWRARHPQQEGSAPRWLSWLGSRLEWSADCTVCEYIHHYRTCNGCGFCDSDGSGRVPAWWDWSVPDGAPADTNAHRPGYAPVTIIEIGG